MAAKAKVFTAIWKTVLSEMWPFDAVTGVGKHTAAFSLRAVPISPSVRSKHSWEVSLWWNHMVITPDEWPDIFLLESNIARAKSKQTTIN